MNKIFSKFNQDSVPSESYKYTNVHNVACSLSDEVWKPVKGFEGKYEVSNKGRVKSLTRMRLSKGGCFAPLPERILKTKISRYGYEGVALCGESKRVDFTIHRLVALNFLDNPENKPTVNHIDGCKTNNNLSNLEFATNSEQMQHARDSSLLKLRGDTIYSPEFKTRVFEFYKQNKVSVLELANKFGISQRTAQRIISGQIEPKRKISREQVKLIKEMRQFGMTLSAIASLIGCGTSQIHRITKGVSRLEKYKVT